MLVLGVSALCSGGFGVKTREGGVTVQCRRCQRVTRDGVVAVSIV